MSSEASSRGPAEVDAGAVDRPPLRSLLFVPGTRTDWLPKARAAGADAAILDLEDAVPAAGKLAARAQVADAVARAAAESAEQAGRMALFVRVNPLDGWAGAEELRAVVRPGLAGVVLPKVRSAQDVRLADRLLGWCEQRTGPAAGAGRPGAPAGDGARPARGLRHRPSLLTHRLPGRPHRPRRRRGTRRRLPLEPRGNRNARLRSRVLLDVRAAGVPRPVSGLWTRIHDLPGLRRFAEQNRSLGYEGMMAIHPSHVPVINEVFSPGPDELARCAELIEAVEAAQATGDGRGDVPGRDGRRGHGRDGAGGAGRATGGAPGDGTGRGDALFPAPGARTPPGS